MKTKSFQQYLETRLDKKELARIEKQAEKKVKLLQHLQQMITDALNIIGINIK